MIEITRSQLYPSHNTTLLSSVGSIFDFTVGYKISASLESLSLTRWCVDVLGGSGDVKEHSRKSHAGDRYAHRHISYRHIALAPDRAVGESRIAGKVITHNATT